MCLWVEARVQISPLKYTNCLILYTFFFFLTFISFCFKILKKKKKNNTTVITTTTNCYARVLGEAVRAQNSWAQRKRWVTVPVTAWININNALLPPLRLQFTRASVSGYWFPLSFCGSLKLPQVYFLNCLIYLYLGNSCSWTHIGNTILFSFSFIYHFVYSLIKWQIFDQHSVEFTNISSQRNRFWRVDLIL